MRPIACLALLVLAGALVAGCATDPFADRAPEAEMLQASQTAADGLAQALHGRLVEQRDGGPQAMAELVLVTSLVEVNDVRRSSGFGRMFSEQVAGRLASLGLNVTEAKMTDTIRIADGAAGADRRSWSQGEFVLSRDVQDLAAQRRATVVIAGTYAVGQTDVLVAIRALDARTGRIVAARNLTVPFSAKLFQTGGNAY